jgi:hypothetical protein
VPTEALAASVADVFLCFQLIRVETRKPWRANG